MKMLRTITISAAVLGMIAGAVETVLAQTCPDNAYVARTDKQGNVKTIVCKCNPGFQKENGKCLPSPGEQLPSIDPAFFVTDDERRSLCGHIKEVTTKQAAFRTQLERLEQIQAGLQEAADVYEVRRELLLGLSADALDFATASVDIMLEYDAISTAAGKANAQTSLTLLKNAKFGVNTLATTSAPAGSKQQHLNAIDAAFSLKNIIPGTPAGLSAEQWKAFSQASDTIPKLLRISERHIESRGDQSQWLLYRKHFDDLVGAGGKLFAPVKFVHSAAHIIDGGVALWLVRNDGKAVDEAFVKSQTARRYYQQRMGELEKLLAFYRERLSRAGMQCP